jgi:hypothetical protein
MKFLAPLYFVLALITGAPAAPAAQCGVPGIFGQALPGCVAASWSGLGIASHGVATTGGWWTNGLNRVWLFTGEDPSPQGGVTLNVPSALFPPSTDGLQQSPICSITAASTNADDSAGYAIPDWPGVLLVYDTFDRVNKQISFQWFAIGTALQPHSSYSLDIICPPKAGQQKVP